MNVEDRSASVVTDRTGEAGGLMTSGHCYHCDGVATVIVTHLNEGTRAYCSRHFLALGSLPSGTACRPTLDMRRCA